MERETERPKPPPHLLRFHSFDAPSTKFPFAYTEKSNRKPPVGYVCGCVDRQPTYGRCQLRAVSGMGPTIRVPMMLHLW